MIVIVVRGIQRRLIFSVVLCIIGLAIFKCLIILLIFDVKLLLELLDSLSMVIGHLLSVGKVQVLFEALW